VRGITLSTVAAGSGSAPYLEQLAERGGGRYYPVVNMEDVPQIFIEETIKTVGSYLIEEQFVPALTADSPILRGLAAQGWPSLYGYNGTQLKDAAQQVLTSPEGDPVLAQWQYGLGRSVAWTSDMKGQWGIDLVRWERFGTFVAQLVGWTVPRQTENALNAEARIEGTQAIISAEARDNDGNPLPDATVSATVIGPDGDTQAVPLRQVGPGQFQATVPSPQTGSYLVQLNAQRNGQPLGQQMVGMVVPYSPEYRQQQSNPALLQSIAEATGGRLIETPSAAFEQNLASVRRAQEISMPLLLLVALLLPLDIAVRRLSLRWRDLSEARSWFGNRLSSRTAQPATVQPMLGSLQRAKARANARTTRSAASEQHTTQQQEEKMSGTTQSPATSTNQPSPDEETRSVEAPQPPAQSPTEEDPLARLRAAKDRARRR
jgi:Ca-activated chloride channel family protein